MLVDVLYDSYRSKDEDIMIYISVYAGKSWTYDKYPSWSKDITISDVDTITDPNYLSNSAAYNGNAYKKGCKFAGVYFRNTK